MAKLNICLQPVCENLEGNLLFAWVPRDIYICFLELAASIVLLCNMPPQIANWDKFFFTLAAFFSCQMMRQKSLVPGASPVLKLQNIMLLLCVFLHIARFGKCLITLVAV